MTHCGEVLDELALSYGEDEPNQRIRINEENNHITEIDLDNYTDFDYTVNNAGNLKEIIEKILSEVQYE